MLGSERTAALAAGLSAELAREEAAAPAVASGPGGSAEQPGPDWSFWDDGMLPLFPLQPPRSGRELLADHVTAMVCCAAMDTAGAAPGLDWLDGPALLVDGVRAVDLGPRVLTSSRTATRNLSGTGSVTWASAPRNRSAWSDATTTVLLPAAHLHFFNRRSAFRSRQFATNGDGVRA